MQTILLINWCILDNDTILTELEFNLLKLIHSDVLYINILYVRYI